MMLIRNADPGETRGRILLLLVLMVGMLGTLLVFLWRIQVRRGPEYEQSLARQTIRRVRLPAERGRILDRNGLCLADNQPRYCVALYLEEIRQPGKWDNTVARAQNVIRDVSRLIGKDPVVTREDIRIHARKRLPLPLLAFTDLDARDLARLSEWSAASPAVDVYVQPCRTYPQGTLAAHVLGFTGVAELSADGDEPFHYYLPEIGGKAGVECRMNDALSGRAGGSLICVDAAGFKHAEISRREAVPGRDVILSIDARIQQLTEQVLADKPGAVVVMNPMNGDVLAMASWPAFNPNDFTPFIPTALWNRLSEDPLRPMLNRAAAGLYPPGSLFKPLVAIAALENGRATPETWFDCPGYFSIGGTQLKCWNLNGHGSLALRKAIEQSCNTYFAALGLQCGYDIIRHTAEAAGLGSRTGIALDYEARGLLPSREWKRQRLGDAWRDGDTCNVSVGQGPVIVTPLQMAVVLSAVANGGHVYRPRLVLETRRREGSDFQPVPSEEVNNLHWSEATLTAVRNGMHDAVEAPSGTGAAAHVPGVRMAGKTGTAEYGPKEEDKRRGWMMVYAPFDNPRYAVVAVLDDAVSGGGTVGPLIREIMRGIFGMTEGEG